MRAPITTFKRARSLRRKMTLPEVVLWQAVRGKKLEHLRFRRQHPIGPYILDFYCPATNLAIEIDGQSHDFPGRATHDARRDGWLKQRGISILRFPATDVLNKQKFDDCLSTIVAVSQASVR